MRVCIEAASLLLRSAGVKNYVYHWVRHLAALAGRESVAIFPPLSGLGELHHERSIAGRAATVAGIGILQFLNYSRLPWRAGRVDIFHHSSLLLRNPPRGIRLTATIHDMTCRLNPEVHLPANVAADEQFTERVLKRACALIAVSASSRNDAVRLLRLPPERVSVIYPGVPERFFNAGAAEAEAVKQKYGFARPYALFVGTIEPRKNVDALLDAWADLDPSRRREFDLVVAGPAGWGNPATLHRLRSSPPGVRYLGYVPEADLPGLTAGAAVFVYPSLYEGFGFPVAQAMAAGTPVITSNVSSLPEITCGAALLVDPLSRAELRDALRRLLECPETGRKLAAEAKRHAARYRWDRCAKESLEFFKRAAG